MIINQSVKRPQKIIFIIAIIVSLCYIFTIGQWDMQTITGWGYDMLDSIKLGIFSDFPWYTTVSRSMPSNYTMIANMTTALWLSPLYIIQTLSDRVFDLVFYELWYKVFIGIIHFVNVYLINKVLIKLNVNNNSRVEIMSLYMLSSVILLAVIGQGQVDIESMLFVLLSFYYLIDGKYSLFAVFMGISMIYKPFSLLIAVPILLLLISKTGIKVICNMILLALPYGINLLITKILMPDYNRYVRLVDEQCKEVMGTNRVEEMFSLRLNSVLVFFASVLIVCFICLYLGLHKKVKFKHYLYMPVICFMSYALFVSPSTYWFILIMPTILLMGQVFDRKGEAYLLNLGINIGVIMAIYISEKEYSPNPELSILSVILGKKRDIIFYDYFPDLLTDYGFFLGTTLFMACILLFVIMYMYITRKGEGRVNITRDNKSNLFDNLMYYIQPLPVIGYLMFAFVEFMV